jgi:hypothetical protein
MDPKAGQILDPKLKEAYDRVMGASLPPTPAAPIAKPAQMEPPKMPDHHEPIDPMMPKDHPVAAAPVHSPAPASSPAAATPGPQHASMSFSTAYVAPHPEKKAPISGALLMVAGVIFLFVYTLFWMKWFGMAIPFLP